MAVSVLDTAGVSTKMARPAPLPLAKRTLDVLLSGMGLLASSPLWALLSVAIKASDGGPVFFSQERVGQGGRLFKAWKFRSMIPDAEKHVGAIQATEHDPRVTRIGRIMRATAMDELPQLWNIFVGDMSFVGPRALRPGEIEVVGSGRLEALEDVPGYEDRCRVRPGSDGHRSDLRAARHRAPQQVPVRLPLHRAPEFLARPPLDHRVVLDHVPGALGNARREDLIAGRGLPCAPPFSIQPSGSWRPCSAARPGASRARSPAGRALDDVVRTATTVPVLAVLALASGGAVASRAVIGYLSPGAYAEEVLAAREFLSERHVYRGDDRAQFARWLREERPATEPWALPGISVCQASAFEHRPQFYTSQAHTPMLLLGSVPLVHLVGGRGLFVGIFGVSAGLLVLAWRTMYGSTTCPTRRMLWRSRR